MKGRQQTEQEPLAQSSGFSYKGESLLTNPVTRRTALKGAAVGATLAGAASLAGCKGEQDASAEQSPLILDASQGTSVTESYTYQDTPPAMSQVAEWFLAPKTNLWAAPGNWIGGFVPAQLGGDVVALAVFSLAGGSLTTLQQNPVNSNMIFFKGCNTDSMFCWVELDVQTNAWKLYAQSLASAALSGRPIEIYAGDADWEPPLMCAAGNLLFFQVCPATSGNKTKESSWLYTYHLGDAQARQAVESKGAFGCAPAVSNNELILTPRLEGQTSTTYAVNVYDSQSLDQKKQLVVPQTVHPLNATTLNNNIAVQVQANYQSGGLLGRMGTFIQDANDHLTYLSREPIAAPSGKGEVVIVKSQASYVVFDMQNQTYGTITASNRCTDWGEYPLRIGDSEDFITFASVKDPSSGQIQSTHLRRFTW